MLRLEILYTELYEILLFQIASFFIFIFLYLKFNLAFVCADPYWPLMQDTK